MPAQLLHAGLIALYDRGAWKGALIQGPSGVGKSDLALRALDLGLRLVSDDRTRVWMSGGRLYGDCPAPIAGLIELRGIGVTPLNAFGPVVRIRLLVRCLAPGGDMERTPGPAVQTLAGIDIPVLDLRPLEASAPAKLVNALSLLGA